MSSSERVVAGKPAPATEKPELRLALGMRGGVSLAVWIGGACAEIDALRRATPDDGTFWGGVLSLSAARYSKVTVDVMAGASAGGLNGVVFAAAIRHGFRMDQLLEVWRKVADVDTLRRKRGPWPSLFDGDQAFLQVIDDRLRCLQAGEGLTREERELQHRRAKRAKDDGYVDLQLSATLVEPVARPATSPGDEHLRRSRSNARFHFRHDPQAVPARRDIEREAIPQMAVAARGTASFPIAFEAAVVRSRRRDRFDADPPSVEDEPNRLADCHGVFSESRAAKHAQEKRQDDGDFLVADGGVVDNIPLTKALDAVRDAPASGPTRRMLVYLHPNGPTGARPPVPERALSDDEILARRDPISVVKGLAAAKLEGELIDRDLERLEAHNRAVRMRTELRGRIGAELGLGREPSSEPEEGPLGSRHMVVAHLRAVVRAALPVEPTGLSMWRCTTWPKRPRLSAPPISSCPPPPSFLAGQRLRAYFVQRAGVDADSVQRLLADPLAFLGEDPFPRPPAETSGRSGARPNEQPEDRWRSPLADWNAAELEGLDRALREHFSTRLAGQQLDASVLTGGFGPITRSIDLLIELARDTEARAPGAVDVGATKAELYRLRAYAHELARVRNLGWVCCAEWVGRTDVEGWVAHTRAELGKLAHWSVDPTALEGGVMSQDFADEAGQHIDAAMTQLQALAEGDPAVWEDGPDVRSSVVARLAVLAEALLPVPDAALAVPDGGGPTSGADVVRHVLQEPGVANDVRLATLEVLLANEHLLEVQGLGTIEFVRMSAAAPIIGARRFTRLYESSFELDRELTARGDHLAPDVKLAGNELANFSAFLERSWRTNDWTWGRLDAAATLVDLLVDRPALAAVPNGVFDSLVTEGRSLADGQPEDPDPLAGDRWRQLIAQRQQEIVLEATGARDADRHTRESDYLPLQPGQWRAGLETLVVPGSPALAASAVELSRVAAQVIGAALPPSVPRIVGPLSGVLALIAKRMAKPRGWPSDRPDADTGEAAQTRPRWISVVLWAGVVLAMLLLPILTIAAADSGVTLAVGVVVGLLVSLVPGSVLLWLATRPAQPPERPPPKRWVLVVGILTGEAFAVTIAVVIANVP